MLATDLISTVLAAAEIQDGILLTADLLRMGCSRSDVDRLLDTQVLHRVCRGAFTTIDAARPPTPESRYRALVFAAVALRAPHGTPIIPAGPASAVLHGLPLLGRAPSVVHVAAPQRGGRKRQGLIKPLGEHTDAELTTAGDIRVAGPARAVVDTARVMTIVAGVAAADAALRAGLLCAGDIDATLGRLQGCRGVQRARKVSELATGSSESPGESWSAVVLDALGLPRPERQRSFSDIDGFIGRVDFWWPEARVVGEFDGRVKYGRTNPSRRAPEDVLWDEKRREDRLRALDVIVVRWTVDELRAPSRLGARLRGLLT